jgi:hypothetical protein
METSPLFKIFTYTCAFIYIYTPIPCAYIHTDNLFTSTYKFKIHLISINISFLIRTYQMNTLQRCPDTSNHCTYIHLMCILIRAILHISYSCIYNHIYIFMYTYSCIHMHVHILMNNYLSDEHVAKMS